MSLSIEQITEEYNEIYADNAYNNNYVKILEDYYNYDEDESKEHIIELGGIGSIYDLSMELQDATGDYNTVEFGDSPEHALGNFLINSDIQNGYINSDSGYVYPYISNQPESLGSLAINDYTVYHVKGNEYIIFDL